MDLSTISSAYSALKTIKELGSSLLDAKIDHEAKQRINELISKLGDIQDTLFYIRGRVRGEEYGTPFTFLYLKLYWNVKIEGASLSRPPKLSH